MECLLSIIPSVFRQRVSCWFLLDLDSLLCRREERTVPLPDLRFAACKRGSKCSSCLKIHLEISSYLFMRYQMHRQMEFVTVKKAGMILFLHRSQNNMAWLSQHRVIAPLLFVDMLWVIKIRFLLERHINEVLTLLTINLKKAEIVVDVLITNPNPLPIPLIDIDYLIESDGRKLVSGLIPDAGTIHAHGSETVKIPFTLTYDDIKSTYSDIKPGSIIPYRIKVDFIVDVPVFGRLTLPLEKKGEIPVPYKPDVDIEKIKFEKFSFEETVATLHLSLENKNDFDLGLKLLEYEIWLSDVSIGSAELTQSTKIEKNGITLMKIPITFRPKDFGSALWDMIRGRGIGYSMKGNIDVDTPFGLMKLPIIKEGGTTRLKKEDDDDDDED